MKRHLARLAMLVLLLEALYCAFQVMVVLQPPGIEGPMLYAAATLDHDLLVARRLYAIEGWIAFVGLAVVFTLAEVGPPGDRA